MPLSRTVTPYDQTTGPASQTDKARHPPTFIPGTNPIESINARLRKVTRNRGHFPSEQSAIKVLYLAIRHMIEPKAGDRNHVAPGWKSALNTLTRYFDDRINIR